MPDYDSTMREGAHVYREELDALRAAGIAAAFIQTGGMNAALEAILDGGAVLLITDAEDSLSWDRAEQRGWGVGLYRDSDEQSPDVFDTSDDTSAQALLDLVRRVLADAVRPAGGCCASRPGNPEADDGRRGRTAADSLTSRE